MFSASLRKYAKDVILWSAFWSITFVTVGSAWVMVCRPFIKGVENQLPGILMLFTGLFIFLLSYVLIVLKWHEERSEKAREEKRRLEENRPRNYARY
ncbi:MAG: hypothetical protein EOP83_34535 [Verrucomicrobiaceae bacterium]|nr:MAG: hypothetical protein EOP83_34535 [Verrucomicrobiaceae bacterium]